MLGDSEYLVIMYCHNEVQSEVGDKSINYIWLRVNIRLGKQIDIWIVFTVFVLYKFRGKRCWNLAVELTEAKKILSLNERDKTIKLMDLGFTACTV